MLRENAIYRDMEHAARSVQQTSAVANILSSQVPQVFRETGICIFSMRATPTPHTAQQPYSVQPGKQQENTHLKDSDLKNPSME